MKARRYGIWASLAIVAAITSGALLAQAPQAIGTWVSIGDLSSPLTNGASVALPDKRTLIAGGALADGTLTDAVTIYDSVDDSAAAAGTLTSARADHTATLLKDGRVLVVGGMTADGLVSSDIEMFDPATGTSAIVALLPEPRNGHVAAALPNGNVLIAGGATVDGAILQTAVLFDPETSGVFSVPGQPAHRSRSCLGDDDARWARARGGRQQRDDGTRVRRNLRPLLTEFLDGRDADERWPSGSLGGAPAR